MTTTSLPATATPLTDEELAALRADFPILSRTVRDGRPYQHPALDCRRVAALTRSDLAPVGR